MTRPKTVIQQKITELTKQVAHFGNGAMYQTITEESDMSNQEEKLIADYRAMPENLKEAFAISFKEIVKK